MTVWFAVDEESKYGVGESCHCVSFYAVGVQMWLFLTTSCNDLSSELAKNRLLLRRYTSITVKR